MEFVSIDVETANANLASICQIGVVRFVDGALADEWMTYVDPEDGFDEVNVFIHGINEALVKGEPTFPEVATKLNKLLNGHIVVSHMHFDRVALHQAADLHSIAPPSCLWLDTAKVARRAWSEFASRGYGLVNVCEKIGYEFKHHDALEDAKAAGRILLAAMEHSGLTPEEWLPRVRAPIDPSHAKYTPRIKREGNPDGPLHGEVLVFTGELKIPRKQAADMAANIGCQVASGVTKSTTLLVVGDQDAKLLAGHSKSSKHRKAESLILKGQPIRIFRESDFRELVELTD